MQATLRATFTGLDRPGITTRLFECLEGLDVAVTDLEQVVLRGQLTLGVLLTDSSGTPGTLISAQTRLASTSADLGLATDFDAGAAEAVERSAKLVVTVLGHPLRPDAVAGLTSRMAEAGANIDSIRRIAAYPVTAIELAASGADIDSLRKALAGEAARLGVDVAVQRGGLNRRGQHLVVLDVDSTLIQDEVVELVARAAGVEDEVRSLTEAAMRGELDFAESLERRVALLAGLDAAALDVVRSQIRLTPGARTLVRTLKRLGHKVALVSGGFTAVVDDLGKELGVDYVRANVLEIVDGKLTGRVTGAVIDRASKAAALVEFAYRAHIPLERTIAIGDGANDLDMIDAAGLGVAFNAKPVVRQAADASVNVPYLDSVLYLLGVSREDIEDADAADI
jgi:phosphoserine phosphatase